MSNFIHFEESWKRGIDPDLEASVMKDLIGIFESYWLHNKIQEKSKTTQRRRLGSFFCLGSYVVDAFIEGEISSVIGYFSDGTMKYGGPLIHHDDEQAQSEIDTTCKQLHKFLTANLP